MAPDNYGKQLTSCPRCGYVDLILSVPAAFSSASNTETAHRVVRDDDASMSSRHAARATISAAPPVVPAKQLAMAPSNTRGQFGCLGVVFGGFFGIFAAGALDFYARYGSFPPDIPPDRTSLVIGCAASIVSLLSFILAISAIRPAIVHRRMVNKGEPAAAAIWRLGWYCCRCAIVYFQAGEAPPGIASGQPLTPAQFQHIVWTAGGYAKTRPPPPPFDR
ncbi:MAG TPA: hypothetical protein VJT72_07150 [Pseudonocardiaceae bacterium]|nr:hypothetical protein [Pseudonocardiaceae bacterium]